MQVNMLEAKTNLSKLVSLIESKEESEIILARSGVPVAKLVAFSQGQKRTIGIAKGKFVCPEDIHDGDAEILAMFGGGK